MTAEVKRFIRKRQMILATSPSGILVGGKMPWKPYYKKFSGYETANMFIYKDHRCWILTHKPTGFLMRTFLKTPLANIKQAMIELETDFDMTFTDPADVSSKDLSLMMRCIMKHQEGG